MPNTIADNLSRLVTAKTDIANAITTMGGTVGSGDGFEEFPADIATIPSGGGKFELTTVNCKPSMSNPPKKKVWVAKSWSGLTSFDGSYIWTDGENIYYSKGSDQYVLNKSTSAWTVKSWSGLTSFDGIYIWTDGENIYWSNGAHLVLDKSTSMWNNKTWSGSIDFYGNNIWTDGDNIYFSSANTHYVLDKSVSKWNSWNSNYHSGYRVWTDGENIYYSSGNSYSCFDKSDTTPDMTNKRWPGMSNLYGDRVWTDGENIYYSLDTNQYVLQITEYTAFAPTPSCRPTLNKST